MTGMRSTTLAVALALGSLGVASSTAQAQVRGQAVATYPRGYVVNRTPTTPIYRTYRRANPRFVQRPKSITPHAVHDWSTGNENLPLAKPWLHNFR